MVIAGESTVPITLSVLAIWSPFSRMNLDELGCKVLMMIDCRWSNEEWNYVGVEEWPSLEALEKRAKFEYEELKKYRIVDSKTYLGTRESFAEYGKE